MSKRRFSDSQEREILTAYQSGEHSPAIARRWGTDVALVLKVVRRQGGRVRPLSEAMRRYPLREDAFDAVTPESAYWVGMLMADGCVMQHKKGGWRVYLGLAEGDAGHVHAFRKFLGTDQPVSVRRPGQYGTRQQPMHTLYVASARLAEALSRYGVTPRKSHAARVVGLEDDRDFWRGCVDGDGFLSPPKRAKSGKAVGAVLGLVGSQEMLSQFSEFLARRTGKRPAVSPHRSIYGVRLEGNSAEAACRLLYDDSVVALPRKLALAREICRRLDPVEAARFCAVPGCGSLHVAHGLCGDHCGRLHSRTTPPGPARFRGGRPLRTLTFGGVSKPLVEWARDLGVQAQTLEARLDRHGWSVEKTLACPLQRGRSIPFSRTVPEA